MIVVGGKCFLFIKEKILVIYYNAYAEQQRSLPGICLPHNPHAPTQIRPESLDFGDKCANAFGNFPQYQRILGVRPG